MNEPISMRYDTTIKVLFKALPQVLLKLLAGQEATELLTVEYPSVKKRVPDLVVRLLDQSIFHMELQSDVEKAMDWRMLEYCGLIRQTYPDARLIQMVLYVGSGKPNFSTLIDEPMLHFRYLLKDIRDIDCCVLLASPCLEENLLAVLCKMEQERETIREIMTRIAVLPPKERADALEKLVILSGLRKLETVIMEEVKEMAISIDVMENAFLRDLSVKAEQKGRKEEAASMLLELLVCKFGQVAESVIAQVTGAEREVIEKWSKKLLFAHSLDDVFAS
ncbi:MAG: DUF4351 domain-containing protein [Magnetococcus sp. YQC-5]